MAQAPEPHQAPLCLGDRVQGTQPHQVAIRDLSYNFGFINSPSMAPEGHGDQVLLEPYFGYKNVTDPH